MTILLLALLAGCGGQTAAQQKESNAYATLMHAITSLPSSLHKMDAAKEAARDAKVKVCGALDQGLDAGQGQQRLSPGDGTHPTVAALYKRDGCTS